MPNWANPSRPGKGANWFKVALIENNSLFHPYLAPIMASVYLRGPKGAHVVNDRLRGHNGNNVH